MQLPKVQLRRWKASGKEVAGIKVRNAYGHEPWRKGGLSVMGGSGHMQATEPKPGPSFCKPRLSGLPRSMGQMHQVRRDTVSDVLQLVTESFSVLA